MSTRRRLTPDELQDKFYNSAWFKSRPPAVQALAREFPLGDRFELGDKVMYLLGWTENDELILTPLNPGHFPQWMCRAQQVTVCARHYRTEH